MKHKFFVEIVYDDNTDFHFNVELEGTDSEVMAGLMMMITRGTLMASSAHRAIAYNEEGFDVCSYIR